MDTIEIQRIADVEDGHWWYRERRAVLARELQRIGALGRAVDIGSAGGGNTRVLLEHGWRATAIDVSETAVDLCLAQGIDAYHGDARYLPLPSDEFDLALALNVLEHIDDDRAAAAEIARVLRPGGDVLVAVPCDMALWSAHDVALGRVRRYSRSGLTELLEGAGLAVGQVWSWNVLPRPAARLLRHRAPRCAEMQPRPVVNGTLRLLAALERRLPLKSLRGTALYARARRP